MGKRNYLIIGATISIFVIAIIAILLSNNKTADWTTDILKAQNYQISMIDCNSREKTLDKKTLTILSSKWNTLSNNGPWMGDDSSCYTTITISYENSGIINEKEILILRYGLKNNEEMTQKEVADFLGISQSYISRLEKKIIKKLKFQLNK